MQVHATSEYSAAIVPDEDSLRRLWGHVQGFVDSPSITATCIDGVERKFTSIDELLQYENPPSSKVDTLEIYGSDREYVRTISISLGRSYGAPAYLSIRGEEIEVSSTKTKVMDTFSGMRAWYSPIATLDMFKFWLILFFTGFAILQAMMPTSAPQRPGRSFVEALQILGSVIPLVVLAFAIVFGTVKLRSQIFPRVAFAFGQGARRYRFDEQVRWTVLVGIVVSVAASAVYSWLLNI